MEEAAAVVEYFPPTQLVQDVDPVEVVCLPVGHTAQDTAPL